MLSLFAGSSEKTKFYSWEKFMRGFGGNMKESRKPRKFYIDLLERLAQPQLSDAEIKKLLQKNVINFGENFPNILKSWANAKFDKMRPQEAERLAATIVLFSNLLQEAQGGRRDINLEIVIAGYEVTAELLTRDLFKPMWAETQVNLGTAYCERWLGDKAENIEIAIQCYTSAIDFFQSEKFPQKWAWAQLNLGTAYYDRIWEIPEENIKLAIKCYQAASQVFTPQSDPDSWALIQNHLGNAYSKGNGAESPEKLKDAIRHYQAALEIHTRERFSKEWAIVQTHLGNVYCLQAKFNGIQSIEQALAAFHNALQVYSRDANPERWITIQNSLGNAYREIGQVEQAIEHYRAALKFAESINFYSECFRLGKNWGDTAFDAKRWPLAIEGYVITTQAIEQNRNWGLTEQRRREILEETIEVYANLVEACIMAEEYIRAVKYADQSRTRSLIEFVLNRESPNLLPSSIAENYQHIKAEIDSIENKLQAKGTKGYADQQRRLKTLKEQRDQLQIAHISIGMSFDFNQFLLDLDDRTAVIAWYATISKLFAFIITRQSPKISVWTAAPEDIQELEAWFIRYQTDSDDRPDVWRNGLSSQFNQLASILHIKELLDSLPSECDRLILIPHRGLHLLPLHALPVTSKLCLLDRFRRGVGYSPSFQLLQLVRTQHRPDFSHLVAIQNPKGSVADGTLAYADVEVETIASFFSSVKALKGESANNADFAALDVKAAHCIHFSCHGYFNLAEPRLSSLLLGDAQLNLDDIFRLNLPRCRLVTLSACETGKIDISTAVDEYLGLPSGFLYAGSPTIVSSLWTVNDLSTALLMIKFYGSLSTEPSIVLALNKAQIWLRSSTKLDLQAWLQEQPFYHQNPTIRIQLRRLLNKIADNFYPFANPYYWAAFCAIGQ